MNKLLIANRGEIACRIMRTARGMGIATVAVFSDADADAPHVRMADQAIRLGPAPARASYLRADLVVAAAQASGADAVHPGYGFLSENAEFAEACAAAGLIFVGPAPAAIRAMGSKAEAKRLMQAAGVPLAPGYHGSDQDAATLAAEAARIGFPVLIKASAGGGGKGMKPALSAAEFPEQLASARREAAAAFGDDRVLIEKYLTRPRHIEAQVFGDRFGNVLCLGDRDCSIQRRHQKVIEEAPAPGLDPEMRAALHAAAVAAAKAVDYVGAGTVEFIVEDGRFYFMEMNTRLQVEHPVTEAVTGLDLVELQLRVARGEALPLTQSDVRRDGCAIEARLYAEDPAKGFLPQTGRLERLVLPEGRDGVRVDAGVVAGGAVSVHYDPMIAKLIAWGPDREAARLRLLRAVEATVVAGLTANRGFLARILAHPAFAAAELDTGFIPRHAAELLPEPTPASDRALAAAALAHLLADRAAQRRAAELTADPWSPWARAVGWRLNRDAHVDMTLTDPGRAAPVELRAHLRGEDFVLDLPGGPQPASATLAADGALDLALGDWRGKAATAIVGRSVTVLVDGEERRLEVVDRLAAMEDAEEAGGRLAAPMPGKVVAVLVAVGERVAKGQKLLVLEAMKMEHAVTAPADGVVARIAYAAGDLVAEGAELLSLDPIAEPA